MKPFRRPEAVDLAGCDGDANVAVTARGYFRK